MVEKQDMLYNHLSLATWTLMLAIYLQAIEYNIWLLFIVTIPIQAIILLAETMPKKRTR